MDQTALVIAFKKHPPRDLQHKIRYWAPKTDWLVTRAEIITITPEDRSTFSLEQLLSDLKTEDAPQIWKQRYWATPRDWRLLERLSCYPRLKGSCETDQRKEK